MNCNGYTPHGGCPGGCGTAANQAIGQKTDAAGDKAANEEQERLGLSDEEMRALRELMYDDRSGWEVAFEALTDLLGELSGFNSMPWHKVPKVIGNKVFDIFKKAWNWGEEVTRARKLMGQIDNARESARKAARSCDNSFVPGTKVLMADGTHKPIEDIKVGELVLATDPITGESGPRAVVATITGHGFKQLVDITIDTDGQAGKATGTISATAEHPLWVENEGRWIDAGDVQVGGVLLTLNDVQVGVLSMRTSAYTQAVYNLTVENIHTYYVLAKLTPLLVHNQDGSKQPGREEARELVMRMAGIPLDSTPIDVLTNASGVQYVYDIDGKYMLVAENTMDRSHPGQAYWEAGEAKANLQIDNYGRYRVSNNKVKVDFSGLC